MRYKRHIWILALGILTIIMNNYLGTVGNIISIVSGIVVIIGAIWAVRHWWRAKHAPWDMYMVFRGKKCKKITILLDDRPIQEDMQVKVNIKRPTIPATIRLADDPPIRVWRWQAPHWMVTLFSKVKHIKMNAREDCGVLIPKIENKTWTPYSQGEKPKLTPGSTLGRSQGIMWNFNWNDQPPLSVSTDLDLRLTLKVTKPWEGYLQFTGDIDNERHRIARRIKVKRINSKTQVADRKDSRN